MTKSMYFEQLPIELIYEIFGYLDILDLYRAFFNLNARMNLILNHLMNVCFHIKSREDANNPLVNQFAQQIVSLTIPQSDYIDSIRFSNIQFLHISDYLFEQQLVQIRHENFPSLVYLNMPFIEESEESSKFFQRIFSNEFPFLRKCILGDITEPDFQHPWSISPSLQSLISTGFSLPTYTHILHSCPNLIYLHWSFIRYSDDEYFRFPSFQHSQLKYLYLRTINIENIRIILSYIPYLKRLYIVSDWSRGNNCLPLNFKQLSQILLQNVPNLNRFDCNTMERNPTIEINIIHKLHSCFQHIQSELIPDGRTRFFTFSSNIF